MKRKLLLLISCTIVFGGVVLYLRTSKEKSDYELVRYVEAKVSKEDVAPGFTPVLIYRVKSFQAGTMRALSTACGTAFIGRSGKWKVLTAAHVFSKEYVDSEYVFRRLRPMEQAVTLGVNSVSQAHDDDFDVVECTVGKPQQIVGFSTIGGKFAENRVLRGSYISLEEANIVGFKSFTLTSVASGEHAKMYAISVKNYGNQFHWIIGYSGVPGESGTGFIDEHRWLYVLSGNLPSTAISKEWRNKWKIAPEEKGFSIVSGPFDLLSPR